MKTLAVSPRTVLATSELSTPLVLRWLGIWFVSRAFVAIVIVATALMRGVDEVARRQDFAQWLLYRFAHFDSHLYGAVADRGYVAEGPASHYNAFFPGLPAILRLWQEVVGTDGRWGGLLMVHVAGALSAVVLGRLTVEITGRPDAGTWAVVLLSISPLTVFFSVVYTEALFLAASMAAWSAARHAKWAIAGVLALFACTLRLNGLFLVAGLVVIFLLGNRHDRSLTSWRRILWLGLGPGFVLAWTIWLHNLTGQWNNWSSALEAGWQRSLAWPWEAVDVGLHNVASATPWHLLVSRALDLGALVVAVLATVHFVRSRDWPTATLVGLNTVTVVCSSVILSGPRYILAWFPLYVLGAGWLSQFKRPGQWAVVIASATLAALFSVYWGAQWWIA